MANAGAAIELEDGKRLVLRAIGNRSTDESLEFALDEIDYWYRLGSVDDDTAYELEKWAQETWSIRWETPQEAQQHVPELAEALANPRRTNTPNRRSVSPRVG